MAMNERRSWYRLDNAAIMIPSTTGGASTRVFRIVCELKEEVKPEILQDALDATILDFPFLNVVLRKGLFWYYLDECDEKPVISIDCLPPCAPLYYPGRRNLLYRITYYHKRINLEMFHVLADGTGAFMFFKALILRYLSLCHNLNAVISNDMSSVDEKEQDAFRQYYKKHDAKKNLKKYTAEKAYQLKGDIDENFLNHLLEIRISSKQFIDLAHQFHTTAGILSVAMYIEAILPEMSMPDRQSPIVVSVPVNLRKYFHSNTARNFYGTINISYDPDHYDGTFESILNEVQKEYKEQLSEESIENSMNSFSAIEHNLAVKLVPLFIKDITIRSFSRKAAACVTGTISNLGVIKMPVETVPYIESFSAFMAKSNMQICISSFEDNMIFGCCTDRTENRVMRRLVRKFTSLGLQPVIASSDCSEEE